MDKLQTLTIDAKTHFAFLQSKLLMGEAILAYQILTAVLKKHSTTKKVRKLQNCEK